ncbi:MAG: exodeoxyribonuclease V subunit gamma [Gemmatimonadetes bacterium]|nr:exodeoxyribonuclease V subunit gamma [Gemmatimonadota bacterium]
MPLSLLTAPRLTPLLEHLAGGLARAPLPPREEEVIVVQSQGMRRWLTLQLADRFGCAGSLTMPFPATFVRELSRSILGEHAGRDQQDPFSRDALTWRIDAMLDALPAGDETFAPLRTYLARADDRTRFGLAAQVAARFDDYQMFRADILDRWEAGDDYPGTSHGRWQGALWRRLRAEAGDGAPHTGNRLQRLIETLQRAESSGGPGDAPHGLPSRVTVFGVSTLPPLFVDLLFAIARHRPVTVYSAALEVAASHPLALAYGGQSREFVAELEGRGAAVQRVGEVPNGAGVLARLQRELATDDAGTTPLELAWSDDSLRVHDAHGAMRQLEVVRDQLLAALAADDTLRPHDLLLLVPDAAEWAPTVDAVFGVSVQGAPRLPYRIADRPLRRAQPAAEALARLLSLEGGRLERSAVLSLLSLPLVRQGAGLAAGDVEWVESALERANVRWGYDGAARSALGFPDYEEASWRAGLDRLLLGVVVGRVDDEVLGLLPEAGDMLGEPELLATFARWVDDLAEMLAQWRHERSLADWTATLIGTIERFLAPDDTYEQQMVGAVAATIRRLSALGEVAGYDKTVKFAVVRDWLETELDDEGFGSGFLQGGMTVAALKPMRSLPFRVIAMVGLDDGVFPRRDRRSAFDLLEHERRAGDRDLRSDDRQLFLDTLMAAEGRLILAYGGRAVNDNSPRAPSVVIDELLDHVGRRATLAAGGGGQGGTAENTEDVENTGGAENGAEDVARKVMVVRHPLQPFSSAYFGAGKDARLFSYSREQAGAARALGNRREVEPPFVVGEVEAPDDGASGIFALTLRNLTDCWTNPSKFFCTRTLRIYLGHELEEASDEETFAPNYMEQGGIRARMLAGALAGTRDAVAEERRLIADGSLPPRELGRAWHVDLWSDVALVLAQLPNDESAATIPITLEGDVWRLTGRIDGVRGAQRFAVRAGSMGADHYLRAWVEHLAMLAAREQGDTSLPDTTVLVWRERDKVKSLRYGPVPNAMPRLAALVESARDGMRRPLPFFARAGYAWGASTFVQPPGEQGKGKGKGKKTATAATRDPRDEATKAYHEQPADYSSGGDAQDAYVALCFRGIDPMVERWDDFERLAERLFDGWRHAMLEGEG